MINDADLDLKTYDLEEIFLGLFEIFLELTYGLVLGIQLRIFELRNHDRRLHSFCVCCELRLQLESVRRVNAINLVALTRAIMSFFCASATG